MRGAIRAIVIIVSLLTIAGPSLARSFDDALAAYARGDYATALELFRPLAEHGEPVAAYNLGVMYDGGQGVEKDASEALRWYRKAADLGYADAQYNLGCIYEHGENGVPQNYAEAMKWYLRAAKQGDVQSQVNLGAMYYSGRGTVQDYRIAATWFQKAANKGDAKAEMDVGIMYAVGTGLPQDNIRAYMWLNLSAAQGNKTASEDRDITAKKMTPEQLAEAQKLTREWKSQGSSVSKLSSQIKIPLQLSGGVFVVPVELNGAIKLDFAVDSGASDVTVPFDVFSTLRRTGTIKDSDILGSQTYVLANGTKSQSTRFTIRSIKVGGVVLKNVVASVSSGEGILLLGQSFLSRFKSWSIDNANHQLSLQAR